MTPFALKIVTPDGLAYDGQAEELIIRATTGDMVFSPVTSTVLLLLVWVEQQL